MSIKNNFGSLLVFSKTGKLLRTLDNVEFVQYSPAMLIDGQPLNCQASGMVRKITSDRVLKDDQIKLLSAYLFDYPLVENVEGFYYDGAGHSKAAIIYKDPSDNSKVITLTLLESTYENLTVIEF
jgi:hypothetical protein